MAALEAENDECMSMNEELGAETQGATHSETQPTQAIQMVFNANKRLKSNVWKEFTPVGLEADGKKGRCVHCSKKLVIEPSQGTSALKRHLKCCPKRPPGLSKENEYDHKVDREMVSEIIIFHDLSFRYVEYEKVRARDKYLNLDCQHICRQTAGSDVFRRYELEKEKLKNVFAEFKGRVCFTADMWTVRSTMMGYICLTAHYVDEDWRLNNKILAFCDMKPPHIGEELASKVLGCLIGWGLEKKVFSLTLDNAKSNDSMQKILQHCLQMISGNGLLCHGNFFHVRCCAHILNLIVQEGLELANNLLENIRDSVKYVKAYDSRKVAFAACVESVGITGGAGLSLDVPTRWNSTYDMLVRALKFRKAFASFKLCDRSYKLLPSEDEWDRGEKILWKIQCLLRDYANCGDDGVETMVKRMQSKFDKYWDEYSIILAMGAVLDPRIKTQILRSAYEKVDPSTPEEKVEIIKKNLKDLYEKYRIKTWTSSSKFSITPTPNELLNESPLDDDPNYDLYELEKSIQPGSDNTKSNLQMYLEESRLELRSFPDIEVLSYWKTHGQRFGDLASLACDVLSIPITTVASESAFSIGGRVLTPYRNHLLPRNFQVLLCTRNWLRGFAEYEGDIKDNFDDGSEDATIMGSSSGV